MSQFTCICMHTHTSHKHTYPNVLPLLKVPLDNVVTFLGFSEHLLLVHQSIKESITSDTWLPREFPEDTREQLAALLPAKEMSSVSSLFPLTWSRTIHVRIWLGFSELVQLGTNIRVKNNIGGTQKSFLIFQSWSTPKCDCAPNWDDNRVFLPGLCLFIFVVMGP